MSKNQQEEIKAPKSVVSTKKTSYSLTYGTIILLVCLGLCISYDLHQTKEISTGILPQMQADYESKIADLNAQIELLERDFNKLKSEHLSVETLSEEYIDTRLDEFKTDILAKTPTNETEYILQTNAKIAELEKLVDDIQKSEQTLPQEILLAAGALTIRSMAENGENFAYEAEVLQIMACENPIAEEYISKIRHFSAQPLETKNSLIKDFKRIYTDLSGTSIEAKNENVSAAESWKNAFFSRLKNLITFNTKKPLKFEPITDQIYDLVENGNLALALQKMKTDPKYVMLNSPVLDAWVHNVQNYLEFDGAVNGLLMNTLASLHLKQFERKNNQ